MFVFFADLNTNECLENNGGCWQDKASNITACRVYRLALLFLSLFQYLVLLLLLKTDYSLFHLNLAFQDTYRGRLCECPTVQGVKFAGDGYTHCKGISVYLPVA